MIAMRVVFMGTPEFSVPTLKALVAAGHEVVLAVSQPDRPSGRGLAAKPTPVKKAALDLGIPIAQYESLKEPEFRKRIEEIQPDAIAVAAYGKILPKWLLDLPKFGCLNVHASLLPKYRGAAPIQRALMNGESETGVTIMKMDEGMDTGDVLLARRVEVGPDVTAGELTAILADVGAKAMIKAFDLLAKGEAKFSPQDHSAATYAPKVEKEEAEIDWTKPCSKIRNLVRALNPSPGAFTRMRGVRVKIFRAREVAREDFGAVPVAELEPGTIAALDRGGNPVALCGGGGLSLVEVQPEGKRPMSGAEFVRGRHAAVGDRFGHD